LISQFKNINTMGIQEVGETRKSNATISYKWTKYVLCQGRKGKVALLCFIEAHLGDRRYSSYYFLTSALEGGEWSASRSGRPLPPGKEPPVPIVIYRYRYIEFNNKSYKTMWDLIFSRRWRFR
jgi:hypothetical protein